MTWLLPTLPAVESHTGVSAVRERFQQTCGFLVEWTDVHVLKPEDSFGADLNFYVVFGTETRRIARHKVDLIALDQADYLLETINWTELVNTCAAFAAEHTQCAT